MTKLSTKKIKEAMINSYGNLSIIARKCDCTRQAIYDFLNKHLELKVLVAAQRDIIIDKAEDNLFHDIKENKEWANKFILKTIGRGRGYIEKTEVEQSGVIGINASDFSECADELRKK